VASSGQARRPGRTRPGIRDVVAADSSGRIATGLRVSVTDRCNLRCSYCMPAEGLDWLPGPALLTDGEMARLITIAVQRLGITEVRFTGAEARNFYCTLKLVLELGVCLGKEASGVP
jgi:cyclic pyranopterin phosphate synthase